jgi:IS605 OrfB family transposase
MKRVIKIQLETTEEQSQVLHETMYQFMKVFNMVCSVGYEQRTSNAYTLQKIMYRDCKCAFPHLVSDLHIQAIRKASETVKSVLELTKKGKKVTCPNANYCPPRYNIHAFKIYWDNKIVSLSTTRGRMHLPFKMPHYANYAVGNKTATADLIYYKGKFYFYVTINLPAVEFVSNGKAIGVDLGVTRPAVSSDNHFHGDKHMKEVIKRIFRLRRALQANGSKSAKRHLRCLADREQRFRRDCDHVISSSIVKGVEPGTTIVLENLTNIRNRVKVYHGEASRRLHSWSFLQLRTFLEYKAEGKGCRVVLIDPRKTSQRCSRCGYIYRGNRRSQSEFLCRKCGFHLNADLQASRNIRDKFLVGWSISPSDALLSTSVSSHPSVLGRDKPTINSPVVDLRGGGL